MTAIAIDLGATRVKLALPQSAATPNRAVQVGVEGCIAIPSCMYVSPAGDVFSGDAAAEAIAGDPAGAVRDVTTGFHRRESIPRNGHQKTRRSLLVHLLSDLRKRCELATSPAGPRECSLTVPAGFDAHRKDCLTDAALEAGFVVTSWSEHPLSVARLWLREGGMVAGAALAVCDIGGVTTELSLLRYHEGRVSLDSNAPPTQLRMGGCDIDDALWELAAKATTTPVAANIAPELRRQLDRAKEKLAAGDLPVAALSAGDFAVAVTAEMVRKSCVPLAARLRDELDRYSRGLGETAAGSIPLVLGGGGSALPGMVESATLAWSRGPVHPLKAGCFAAVLGSLRSEPASDSSAAPCAQDHLAAR
jgi:molecular chaperone DnaK (HSP70)